MKLVNLDQDSETIRLCDVGIFEFFRLPAGDTGTVYQVVEIRTASCIVKVRSVESNSIYNYENDKRVYPLECELHYKRMRI